MREILIGADGGGTKTNYLALDAKNGQPIAKATADSIHALSLGMERAVHNLQTGIAALELSSEDVIIGLSIGDPAIDDSDSSVLAGEELRKKAEAFCSPNGKCFSKSDVFMALYGFSGGTPAALLVAGTGSMGIALTKEYRHGTENKVTTVGGWGNPTCDPGSGYWIAVQGIQAAIHAFDGIAPKTALCEAILPFFGAEEPRKLIDIFNSDALVRSQIAAFSKQVADCAQQGDAIARGILVDAGTVLARYAGCLLREMEHPKIGVYGSVLLHDATVRSTFEAEVKAGFPTAEIGTPDQPPEYGAAIFAADALKIDRRTWL